MRKRALLVSLVLSLVIPVGARALPAGSPEEVGLSRERLARIGQMLNGQIEIKSFPGAVALVAGQTFDHRERGIRFKEEIVAVEPANAIALRLRVDIVRAVHAPSPCRGRLKVSAGRCAARR